MGNVIALGKVESWDEDGAAWGTFDNGTTVDLPLSPIYHSVGDDIRLSSNEPTDEIPYEYTIMVFGDAYASVLMIDETSDGYAVQTGCVLNREGEVVSLIEDIPSTLH